ncbi:MAG: toast rack family protein [Acidobacteriia bacterium]|nr:toast rack family protein [Terriglobia bacterium]
MLVKRTLLIAGIATLAGCGTGVRLGPMEHETKVLELDKSEMTRVELKIGAGTLRVEGASPKLMEGNFDYNDPGSKPQVEYHSTGVRSDIEVHPSGTVQHGDSKWDIRLNDSVGMDLVVKMGAGEAHLNLGSLNLRSVAFDLGAGEVDADLRGNPKRSYDVQINGGVGQATVHLPRSVGISATAVGGIGQVNVSGLEKRNGRWINPGHENAPVTIRLDVKGGVGQIDLVAE